MGKQSVREVMTPNPRTVSPEQSVVEAARILRDEDVGSLPVVEDDRLVGVVTDRDIVVRVVAGSMDPRSTSVGQVESRDVVSVTPDQDLDQALAEMARHQIRRLLVVEDDRLVGVVAQADVARKADEEKTGEVVEQISEPS